MNYCQFSCDNHRSNIQVFRRDEDYVVYIARMEFSRETISQLPDFNESQPLELETTDTSAYSSSYQLVEEILAKSTLVEINLPFAGETKILKSAESCIDLLLSLSEVGYYVPGHAIEKLNADVNKVNWKEKYASVS